MAIVSTIVFHILHRNEEDTPFTITILWRRKGSVPPKGGSKKNADPFNQCAKRRKLAKVMSEMTVTDGNPMKFEILSTKKQTAGAIVFGVLKTEQNATTQARKWSEAEG